MMGVWWCLLDRHGEIAACWVLGAELRLIDQANLARWNNGFESLLLLEHLNEMMPASLETKETKTLQQREDANQIKVPLRFR